MATRITDSFALTIGSSAVDLGGGVALRPTLEMISKVSEQDPRLDEREQVTKVYCPHFFDTKLKDGRIVKAYTFVVRREHEQYAGQLSLEEQARLVAQGVGEKGPAIDYLINTVQHIDELGIKDTDLHKVLKMAQKLAT